MKLKIFIVSLCCLLIVPASFACGGYYIPAISELYMFKAYNPYEGNLYTKTSDKQESIAFWHGYTNKRVSPDEIEHALYECSFEEMKQGDNVFFNYLSKQKDTVALRYWYISKKFYKYLNDPWYFMNLADRAELKQLSQELAVSGNSCIKPQLKERFLLQLMRINFYLDDFEVCKELFEAYPEDWRSPSIKQQCHSYYAGALYRLGEVTHAMDIYAETGDTESLLYIGGPSYISELYQNYPNSKALAFYLQKYLNNSQDAGTMDNKDEFKTLCKRVLAENKTQNPALWQSAWAHIEYLDGNLQEAIKLIEKASNMAGSEMVMDNVRMLRLLYHAADASAADYDNRLCEDLQWLLRKVYEVYAPPIRTEMGLDNDNWLSEYARMEFTQHYINMLRRTIFQYLVPHYEKNGNTNMVAALLNAFDESDCYDKKLRNEQRKSNKKMPSYEYGTYYFAYLDDASIETVQGFLAFIKSGGNSKLEKTLIQNGYVYESMINELIGTKYMRKNDFDNAIVYLKKVQSSFYKKQNITDYLKRNPFEENWVVNSSERSYTCGRLNPAKKYKSNPTKLQFCLIMKELEQQIAEAKDVEILAQANYAYAVGLLKSQDDCWALTQYSSGSGYWSVIRDYIEEICGTKGEWDYLSSNDYAFQQYYKTIHTCLQEAENKTKDRELQARCQYMLSYMEVDIAQQQYKRMEVARNFKDTRFNERELSHCDCLADYR